ncbi:hypothetical protein OH492_28045 [Vibrio chagasii]|nr:hypothetical protein [Vibrio chagasii]
MTLKRAYSNLSVRLVVISKEGKGLKDISTYDSVTINMDYKGQENPRFRFYGDRRNYDEKVIV